MQMQPQTHHQYLQVKTAKLLNLLTKWLHMHAQCTPVIENNVWGPHFVPGQSGVCNIIVPASNTAFKFNSKHLNKTGFLQGTTRAAWCLLCCCRISGLFGKRHRIWCNCGEKLADISIEGSYVRNKGCEVMKSDASTLTQNNLWKNLWKSQTIRKSSKVVKRNVRWGKVM